jgi:nesprin-1
MLSFFHLILTLFSHLLVQDLLAEKEQGFALFNAALESGEKLYPNTSNEGREEVRRELRNMREQWESFSDKLNDTQRSLEGSRMQWQSFDENFDQLTHWVHDMENQVITDPDLKATLQEKKAQLQNLKVTVDNNTVKPVNSSPAK